MAVRSKAAEASLPLWLVVCGSAALAVATCSIIVVLLPHQIVAKSKLLRAFRSLVLRRHRRLLYIWRRSPLVMICVFLCKKCFFGRLSSRCRMPDGLMAVAKGSSEICIRWTPRLPFANAFHEERYVIATRVLPAGADSAKVDWEERELSEEDVKIPKDDMPWEAVVDQLPENSKLQVRLCAQNIWGRGPWSQEVSVNTLAQPVEGGYTGPLGPAATVLDEGRRCYRWMQSPGEVSFKVPIGSEWASRDIQFKVTPTRLHICHEPGPCRNDAGKDGAETNTFSPERVLLSGNFPKRVKVDEVFWSIEDDATDGRHIVVQMAKDANLDKWPCLVEGDAHPCIDVRSVRMYTKDMDSLRPGEVDVIG
eukprot:TRINITY_DN17823_c0_g1_i1.p1 TRINITY_DN17823_c0_g1~~TRINITY_DN17823_c0_g1_i1.p1  ORF type:complete len:365 (-),score=41.20 TRINITY_DN17823_c0_g1_i1:98-1192(-)